MAPELTADRAVDHTKTTFRSRRQFLQKDEVAGFHTNLTDRPGSGAVDGAHGQADGGVLVADFVAAFAVDLGPMGNSAVQRFITASVAR